MEDDHYDFGEVDVKLDYPGINHSGTINVPFKAKTKICKICGKEFFAYSIHPSNGCEVYFIESIHKS